MSDPTQDGHDPLLGRALGRFTVRAWLGTGAVGSVYRADDAATGASVALKVLRPEFARDVQAIRRLEREADFARRVAHPNVVRVIEVGGEGGPPFVAMELITGRSLDEVIARDGPLTPERALRIASGVVAALVHAHAHGVVHRDLKPANVMLEGTDAEERAKLVDFGVARVIDAQGSSPLTRLTREGFTVGTPAYMAPEQFSTADVGPSADLYAVGLIVFEMLTGVAAFRGNLRDVVLKQMTEQPPPLPPYEGLGPLVARLTEKEERDRPTTAALVLEELTTIARAMQRTNVGLAPGAGAPNARARASPHTAAEATAVVLAPGPDTRVPVGAGTREAESTRSQWLRARWPAVAAAVVGLALLGVWLVASSREGAAPVVRAPVVRAPVVVAPADRAPEPGVEAGAPDPGVEADAPAAVADERRAADEPRLADEPRAAAPSASEAAAPAIAATEPPSAPSASRSASPRPSRVGSPRATPRASRAPAASRRLAKCQRTAGTDGKSCLDELYEVLLPMGFERDHWTWRRYTALWDRSATVSRDERAQLLDDLRALARDVERLP